VARHPSTIGGYSFRNDDGIAARQFVLKLM
jgi:hypothetical protein